MRYYDPGGGTLTAFQWRGGSRDSASVEDLHAAGAPVQAHHGAPGGPLLTLFVASRSVRVGIAECDWLVSQDEGKTWFAMTPMEWDRMAPRPEAQHAAPEPLPLPGLSSLHLERVGYRRWNADHAGWDFRSAGLTVTEMEWSGWQPLYTATAPERAHLSHSGSGTEAEVHQDN